MELLVIAAVTLVVLLSMYRWASAPAAGGQSAKAVHVTGGVETRAEPVGPREFGISALSTTSSAALTLEQLSSDRVPDVRKAVAQNFDTPQRALDRLSKDSLHWVRAAAASNPGISSTALHRLWRDEDQLAWQGMLLNPSLPGAMASALAQEWLRLCDGGTQPLFTVGLAQSPHVTGRIASVLATEGSSSVRWFLARNRVAGPLVLVRLARDSESTVRGAVAGNEAAPDEARRILLEDDASDVRAYVAENSTTPPATLARLARDAAGQVRASTACNSNLSPDLLVSLAADDDVAVRAAVAGNASCPASVLDSLVGDHPDGESGLALNDAAPVSLLLRLNRDGSGIFSVPWSLGHNKRVPLELQRELASHEDPAVRAAVARNPELQEPELRLLARDAQAKVRQAAAANRRLPVDVRAALAEDSDAWVRQSVAEHVWEPLRR